MLPDENLQIAVTELHIDVVECGIFNFALSKHGNNISVLSRFAQLCNRPGFILYRIRDFLPGYTVAVHTDDLPCKKLWEK